MNINDMKVPEDFVFPDDLLSEIFKAQASLAKKYSEIEGHSGWPCENIDSKETQRHIRDYAWRCVEELTEMRQAEKTGAVEEHGFEELGDALHFLTEMCLIFDYDYHRLCPNRDDPMSEIFKTKRLSLYVGDSFYESSVGKFIEELGWAINFLKNKAWKQTMVPTDIKSFVEQIDVVWNYFAQIAIVRNINEKGLYLLYFKKEKVNRWRQKTNY